MSKFFKTLISLFIILSFTTTLAFATDINMNLENPNENIVDGNSINANNINATANANTMENIDNFESDTISGTSAPSSVSSIAQENMSFSNILNILVITVGVILILLAIAILIRLRS